MHVWAHLGPVWSREHARRRGSTSRLTEGALDTGGPPPRLAGRERWQHSSPGDSHILVQGVVRARLKRTAQLLRYTAPGQEHAPPPGPRPFLKGTRQTAPRRGRVRRDLLSPGLRGGTVAVPVLALGAPNRSGGAGKQRRRARDGSGPSGRCSLLSRAVRAFVKVGVYLGA